MIIKSAEFMTLVPPHRRSSALELKHQISSLKRVLLLFYFEGSYFYLFLRHTSCMVSSSLMFSLFLILQLLSGSDFLFASFPLTSGSVFPVTSKMSKLRSESLSKVLQTVGLRELDLERAAHRTWVSLSLFMSNQELKCEHCVIILNPKL